LIFEQRNPGLTISQVFGYSKTNIPKIQFQLRRSPLRLFILIFAPHPNIAIGAFSFHKR